MCRFVAYKGADILMADLITRSKHSLIRQSYEAAAFMLPISTSRSSQLSRAHPGTPTPSPGLGPGLGLGPGPGWENQGVSGGALSSD